MGKMQDIINNTKKPHTISTIAADCSQLGVCSGDIVLVHASLSQLGYVAGGAEAVVRALLQAVGDMGTLVMPAHTMINSNPEDWENPPVPEAWHACLMNELPAFDPKTTPSCMMGAIAEVFRTFPGTMRSHHPHTSFCANGRQAAPITQNHVLTPQFGMDTPLGELYLRKVKVLLLGVTYNKCTCFHMSETLSDVLPMEKIGAAVKRDGIREWVWFNDIDWDTDDFIAIGKDFEHTHSVTHGTIGNAACALFDLHAAVDFGKDWIVQHRTSAKA